MFPLVFRLAVIAVLLCAGAVLWFVMIDRPSQPRGLVGPAVEVQPQPPVTAESGPVPSVADEVRDILERNIFQANRHGSQQAATEGDGATDAGDAEAEQLAETQLRLSLLGTVTGNQEDARAIVRDETTNLEDLYRVGSELQGAKITRITRGKVVFQIHGREEILVVNEREGDGAKPAPGRRGPRMPVMQEDQEKDMEPETPTVTPRRRISFRNNAAQPPAAADAEEETEVVEENEDVSEEPEESADAPVEEEAQADTPQPDAVGAASGQTKGQAVEALAQ